MSDMESRFEVCGDCGAPIEKRAANFSSARDGGFVYLCRRCFGALIKRESAANVVSGKRKSVSAQSETGYVSPAIEQEAALGDGEARLPFMSE